MMNNCIGFFSPTQKVHEVKDMLDLFTRYKSITQGMKFKRKARSSISFRNMYMKHVKISTHHTFH